MPRPLVIVLASLLKPLGEPRLAQKLAPTLAQWHLVHVVAPASEGPSPASLVREHALAPYARGWRARLAQVRAHWRQWRQLAPQVLVVSSPELLLPAVLYTRTVAPRARLLYDVRENYFYNLRYQAVYPPWLKYPLAYALRAIELATRPFVAYYLLAEQTYWHEMPFVRAKATVLENKYAGPRPTNLPRRRPALGQPWQLLYTGTINRHYGLLRALAWVKRLNHGQPAPLAHLHMLGHCPDAALAAEVEQMADNHTFIKIELSATPVAHARIVAAIGQAHAGLLPYWPNRSTDGCRPARLYEYAAHGLPMLVAANPGWAAWLAQHQAGLVVDFEDPQPSLTALVQGDFYPQGPPASAFWGQVEAERLKRAVEATESR
jgi:glycogen synthase